MSSVWLEGWTKVSQNNWISEYEQNNDNLDPVT